MNGSEAPSRSELDSAARQVGNGLLSIIMPARNLGASIAGNVRKVHSLFSGKAPFEIIAVDDGSEDDTRRELEKITAALPEARAVYLTQNAGKGAALKEGFNASRGNYVLFLDADLDLSPHQAFLFFEVMEREHADVVIGSKRHPDSVINYPKRRRLISAIYYALVKLLIGLPVTDTQTGIKLFKRETLEWAFPRMLVKRFAFDVELLAVIHEKGARIAEAPVVLQFQGKWGAVRPSTVKEVMIDTLAIFYRLRLLRYYQTIRHTSAPNPPPMISIIIAFPVPTVYVEECIRGIQKQTYKNWEVILLPDAPSGREWPAGVREAPTGRLRPAEKRNIGINHARGSIAAFIDDDTVPIEGWLQHAVVYFSDESVAAVGGPASTPPNDPYLAKVGGAVYENFFVSGKFRYRYVPERVREIDDFPSCNLLVRIGVLNDLHGFRADFWPGEDTYLCLEITRKLGGKIIYEPRAEVCHHRRKLFLPHLRQVGRYALHRGYFARHFPETSRKLSYMMPSLFVLGLLFGGGAAFFCPWCRPIYLAVALLYAVVTWLSCASFSLSIWALTWIGVVLTHIVYGVRFIQGLCSSRMPNEAGSFDHVSEEAGKLEDGMRAP